MISSIVLTGCHNIAVSSNNKIKVDGNILSVEKDIPFVRYRFNNYGENEIAYIKNMMNKFEYSTHLVEINLSANTANELSLMSDILDSIAKYIYIDITDSNVDMNDVSEEVKNYIDSFIDNFEVDRIMLRDKTSKLDTVAAKKIIKSLEALTGLDYNTFGVCSSPLSFGDWACLTAVRARELMAIYSKYADVALPSANHQCMNCCGCIRYFVVSNDTEAPLDTKAKTKTDKEHKEKTEKANNKDSKPKKSKASYDLFAGLGL